MRCIHWPDGSRSRVPGGTPWLQAAMEAAVTIPTGCLGGSCGACEIDVNGSTVRACIASVPATGAEDVWVELPVDPHW